MSLLPAPPLNGRVDEVRYGGPGSQLVSNRYDRDWQSYLACEKKYITIILDGRGTGFRGRQFRNPVTDNLGYHEVLDQVAAAREVAKRRYVDRDRIGIWGWVGRLDSTKAA